MSKLIVKAEVERTDKGMRAVASSGVVDRHGEIVSVEGWDLKNFKKNPVLLWSHDHMIPAIGTAKGIKVEGVGKTAKLTFEPVFHDKTPEAAAIKALFEGTEDMEPVLGTFSVGFRPIDMDGNVYTKQELLEISAVNVPANPDARMMAYKSLESAGFEKSVIKNVLEPEEDELINAKQELIEAKEKIVDLEEQVGEMQSQIDDVVKGLKILNPLGRSKDVAKTRLNHAKVIARATDKILEKNQAGKSAPLVKVIKRANERLIVDLKQEVK